MNVSSFLRQSAGKIKPLDFLQENDAFLRSLRECLIPKSALQDQTEKDQKAYQKTQESINYLLNQVRKRAMMPSPAIAQIAQLLLTLPAPPPARKGKPCDPSKQKRRGVLIDEEGNEIPQEIKEARVSNNRYDILLFLGEFDAKTDPKTAPKVIHMWQHDEQWKEKLYQDAVGKCHRLLFKHENSVECRIVCSDGISTTITRSEAIAALFPGQKHPFCKKQVKSSSLKWHVVSKAYKQHRSHG